MYTKLKALIVETMKKKDLNKLSFLRYLDANIQNLALQKKVKIDDAVVVESLKSDRKKLVDEISYIENSSAQFTTKSAQLDLISSILPKTYSALEHETKITELITSLGLTSIKEMGKLMVEVKKDTCFDMRLASEIIKHLLK